MCGIVGLVAPTIDRDRLLQANDLLAHRGPDDASVYVDEGVGLGARRLSIIDLQGGRQPLCNEDGTVWITYNGEVFNAPELRQDLEYRGHSFATLTDTEVIVHGYEEWGLDVVSRLRGMFAFGLWDTRRQRLVLARDRFGIKPLYYARVGGAFAFASEIRPLFVLLPALTPQTDLSALAGLFEAGFIACPQTVFASVNQLPPAHTLVLERGQITIAPYWQLTFPPDDQYAPLDIVSATEQFAEKLRETVTTWRLSDVEVGSLLSGGIDSGMLAAMLTNSIQKPIHTFNIAFDAATHNESHQAYLTAKHIQSIHNELNFSTSAFDLLPEVVAHLESPLCSATAVPIAMLYRACREAGFKVILTGEGADELLGGYHWYDGDRRIQPLLWLPRMLRKWLAALPLSISPSGRRVLREGTPNLASRFWLWQQVSTPELRAELLKTVQPTGTRAHRSTGNRDFAPPEWLYFARNPNAPTRFH